MNLSNPQRIFKLASSLLRHPHRLPAYCWYHQLLGRQPLDVGLPWWSFDAIAAVKKFCSPSVEAFEFGSGGSTIFLAARCQKVTAVEDDPAWFERMQAQLARSKIDNAELHLRPFDFVHPTGFERSDYLHCLADRQYDLIVVDGQDWTMAERPVCFARAEQHIRAGGLIVVDDSWRYPQLRRGHRARAVETWEGVGPCRVGVTSTDLYYY